jgi:Holliday junction resolvase RusA-like endonuclease
MEITPNQLRWWFSLPFPTQGVNLSTRRGWGFNGKPTTYKTAAASQYEQEVKLKLRGWEPPKQTSLAVVIDLFVPQDRFRRIDADKWAAVVLDALIGPRADQWIDLITIAKHSTPDPAGSVEVEVLARPNHTAGSKKA